MFYDSTDCIFDMNEKKNQRLIELAKTIDIFNVCLDQFVERIDGFEPAMMFQKTNLTEHFRN